MLTLEEAQQRLLGFVVPLPAEYAPLRAARDRILAEDVAALLRQPPFAASAMDGYAIRYDDLPGPWRLVGESAAGAGFTGTLGSGESVRIFTGAPLPSGADTVVIQEEIARDGDHVQLSGEGPPRRGAHVRAAGLDFDASAPLLARGTRLTTSRIGLLAAAGHATAPVHRRPRVTLLATGSELVPPGVRPGLDQIVSSNGVMLAALFEAAGAVVHDAGIIPDDRTALEAAITAAAGAELLITIGGASVGDHDLVLPALKARGATIDFWRVAIKPGKPMLAGRLGATNVLGLPGNPVSAFVCAHLFVLPMIRRMAGSPAPLAPMIEAQLTRPLGANGPRRDHLRATLAWSDGGWTVTPAPVQDSSMLSVLAQANALLVRPSGAPPAPAGSRVPVLPLDKLSEPA